MEIIKICNITVIFKIFTRCLGAPKKVPTASYLLQPSNRQLVFLLWILNVLVKHSKFCTQQNLKALPSIIQINVGI